MGKIQWCASKKEGLKLSEPSSNLAEAYLKKAEGALESVSLNIVKEWKIATAYYSLYFSLYSILSRIGVKCGIHSCTIEFAKMFLSEDFSSEEIEFLEDSLKARIDSQYYVNQSVPDEMLGKMIAYAPSFFAKCKSIIIRLSESRINKIRADFQADYL